MPVFRFTGYRSRYYLKYLDLASGHTLVASPNECYEMTATEPGLIVPPADGFWEVAETQPPALPAPPQKSLSDTAAEEIAKPKKLLQSKAQPEETSVDADKANTDADETEKAGE